MISYKSGVKEKAATWNKRFQRKTTEAVSKKSGYIVYDNKRLQKYQRFLFEKMATSSKME